MTIHPPVSRGPAIDFYFDFLSPFSYLASHRLAAIADRHDAQVRYHAIELGRAKDAIGNVGPANRDLPVKLAYLATDLQRWASRYGLPLAFIPNYNTHRLNSGIFYAACAGHEADYVRVAYQLTWGEGQAPDDEQVLRRLAADMGWDAADFLRFTESEQAAQALRASTDAAITRRVFGVPTMLIGDQMWWGNDRLDFMQDWLASHTAT